MIEELKRFLLVAQTSHITKSAQMLFLTQSALSQSIRRLEKTLGKTLFVQKGKQLHLTPDGEALVIVAEKILTLWGTAQDKNQQTPTYTIGLFDNAAIRLGKYFQEKAYGEDFRIELIIDSSAKLFSHLRFGTIDLAICVKPLQKTFQQEFVCVQEFEEKLVPVTAEQCKGEIQNLPFILYNKGSYTRDHIDYTFRNARITPTIYAESTSITFMKELARLGCGIALLPENVVDEDLQQKKLVEQKLPLVWKRIYGIYQTKHRSLQQEQVLQDIIKTLNKKHQRFTKRS